jgi:hypothetical protein
MVGADDANNEFASTNVTPNADGSVLERLEDLRDKQSRCVVKALAAAGITGTATQFTITGIVAIKHLGILVTTAIPAGANTCKFQFVPTGGVGTADLSAATDTASAAKNQLFVCDGVKATALVKVTDVGIMVATNEHMPLILGPGAIQTVFSAGPPATGAVSIYVEYEPLVPGALIG